MDRNEVEVNKNAKRKRPISSHLNQTTLVKNTQTKRPSWFALDGWILTEVFFMDRNEVVVIKNVEKEEANIQSS